MLPLDKNPEWRYEHGHIPPWSHGLTTFLGYTKLKLGYPDNECFLPRPDHTKYTKGLCPTILSILSIT
jgi:hypothetical protein